MAKKKKEPLIDDTVSTAIESSIRLEEIRLKDMKWYTKLKVATLLPKGYHLYKVILTLNEEPYNDRIADLEQQLSGSLFEDEKNFRKNIDKQIASVRTELENRRAECERMEFNARTEEMKWKDGDTLLLMVVPDDVIEAFNRQKTRLGLYKIILEAL